MITPVKSEGHGALRVSMWLISRSKKASPRKWWTNLNLEDTWEVVKKRGRIRSGRMKSKYWEPAGEGSVTYLRSWQAAERVREWGQLWTQLRLEFEWEHSLAESHETTLLHPALAVCCHFPWEWEASELSTIYSRGWQGGQGVRAVQGEATLMEGEEKGGWITPGRGDWLWRGRTKE